MSPQIDPTTLALTGQLPAILLAAALLALPVSLGLLWFYKRAVLRSMRVGATARPSTPSPEQPPAPSAPETRPILEIRELHSGSPENLEPVARGLHHQLSRAPLRTALAYAIGGFAFASVITAAFLVAGGIEFAVLRFLLVSWNFSWPVVLTTALAFGSTRRPLVIATAGYFLVFAALGAIGVARSPSFDWNQAVTLWIINNGPPTILLLAFLNRRVRAVGPLVLIFMVVSLTGATLVVSLTGSSTTLMRAAVSVGSALGLGATGIFIGLHLAGFILLSGLGWLLLLWMRRRYERKKASDESITFDAIWLLFAIVQSIGLVFEGAWWILSGIVAFAAYKVASALALSLLPGHSGAASKSTRLLLLRVFALGRRSERLFDALGSYWRRIGSIQLIAGPDLVTKTVEPHEFLDFVSGKLARRFIDGPGALEQRLSEMDVQPDRDGRYRVNDFFCHDNTWRTVLSRLVSQSDTVLMDLRSFSPQNAGVTFEVEETMNLVPLERAVFVVDDSTSEPFLREVVARSWDRLRPSSPNRGRAGVRMQVIKLHGSGQGVPQLLGALCTAAQAK